MVLELLEGSEILLTNSIFRHGYGSFRGGAIHISFITVDDDIGPYALLQTKNVFVKIMRSTFLNNSAEIGGAISMTVMNKITTQTYIIDCVFLNNSAERDGGAILLNTRINEKIFLFFKRLRNYHQSVIIENSTVSDNSAISGAGVYIYSEDMLGEIFVPSDITVVIHSTRFERNSGTPIDVSNIGQKCCNNINIYVRFSQFHSNLAINPLADHDDYFSTAYYGIININQESLHFFDELCINRLSIEDTEFVGNRGSCIMVSGSQLTLLGKVTFTGNTAFAGTATLLDCQYTDQPSILNLYSNTTVLITNNTALNFGGGIAVNPVCYESKLCFYNCTSCRDQSDFCVYMDGNSASISGNSLYGPSTTLCRTQPSSLFQIAEGFSTSEVILFDTYTVCICIKNSTTNQMYYDLELNRKVRPGQEITVQAAVCTWPLTDNHTGSYTIRATILTSHNTGYLGTRQNIQEVTKPCDTLIYSVMTTQLHVTVKLTHDTMSSTQSTSLELTILPCPQGFQLDSSLKCDCIDYLLSAVPGITCNITTNLIAVPAGVWIGNYTDKLAAHINCPLIYCKAEPFIDLEQPYLQCTNNRSGVLCGACKTKLSLTFGTARCVDSCSNYYLFLVIPLALAGVLLVFLLFKCNLTVSVGSTNALIFYANIIHVNRTVFFSQNNDNTFSRVLAVFIAWLNLDLGIDTCFYKGMTAYGNTWMQFVFPVYIWILALIITYISRYSVTISRLIGRNSAHVLATLFLLSYAKLLRTVIAAVSPITIRDESGNIHLV